MSLGLATKGIICFGGGGAGGTVTEYIYRDSPFSVNVFVEDELLFLIDSESEQEFALQLEGDQEIAIQLTDEIILDEIVMGEEVPI